MVEICKLIAPPVEYRAYIDSDLWKFRRNQRIAEAGGRCQVCNGKDELNVHHRTYERLGNELPEDLFVLCRECHQIFHDNGRLARSP